MKKENISIYSVILEESGIHQCSSMYPKAQLLIASISLIADLATPQVCLGGRNNSMPKSTRPWTSRHRHCHHTTPLWRRRCGTAIE